jgi:hypothetical protein
MELDLSHRGSVIAVQLWLYIHGKADILAEAQGCSKSSVAFVPERYILRSWLPASLKDEKEWLTKKTRN